jgi:hypothetical protein
MASPAIDILRAKAFELPVSQRAELAHDLLASLDGPADPDVSEAWETEILGRLDQLDDATGQLVDRAELRRWMRNRMANT